MANIDGSIKQNRYASNGLDLNRDQTKLMAIESVSLSNKLLQILILILLLTFMSIGPTEKILPG